MENRPAHARPDYDEQRSVTYQVTYRNVLGLKTARLLSVNFQRLQAVIAERENGKPVVVLPASQIRMAIPSENVATQVTILTPGATRECYKVWVDELEQHRVQQIIRDLNQLVQLQQDLLAEQTMGAK